MDCKILEKTRKKRNDLIDQLTNNTIDKTDFIYMNYKFFKENNFRAFSKNIDSCEKCIYNYQYYNIMAKYSFLKMKEYEFKNPKVAKEYFEAIEDYYYEKDKATAKLLELVDYDNVQAYYINTNSEKLDGQLYEIVFETFENVIFHSKDKRTLNRLKKHNQFSNVKKNSLINQYINTIY